jgi:hypothetical protein
MPFLLERNVSVVIRGESGEDELSGPLLRYTSMNSSVKRPKDE